MTYREFLCSEIIQDECHFLSCLGFDCFDFGVAEHQDQRGKRRHSNNDGQYTAYILCSCVFMNIITSLVEYSSDQFWVFAMFSLIPQMIASTLLEAISKSALMDNIPVEHIGKTLGILNMSTSGLSVVCPLYGALIFDYFGGYVNKGLVSSVHYGLLLVVVMFLSIPSVGSSNNDILSVISGFTTSVKGKKKN